jgi:hypothetical protein
MDIRSWLDLYQTVVNPTDVVLLGLMLWNLRFATRSFKEQNNAQVNLAYTERYETLMGDCSLDFRTTPLDLTLAEVESKDRDRIHCRGGCCRWPNLF